MVLCHRIGSKMIILQAWNTQTNTDLSLNGPVGQVYALVVGNDLLFAGTQVISSCKSRLFLKFYLFSSSCCVKSI